MKRVQASFVLFTDNNFSCLHLMHARLVIATKFCPKQMLLALWPYLGQSRPFSVFFPLKEVCVRG